MTEKRFTHKKWYDNRQLFDGDEAFAIVDVYNQAVTICNKLNELAGENQDNKAMIEFLSTENTQIMNELKTRTQIQHQLEEENEQLKQLIKRTLETTPIEHTLAMELKNNVRELYD